MSLTHILFGKPKTIDDFTDKLNQSNIKDVNIIIRVKSGNWGSTRVYYEAMARIRNPEGKDLSFLVAEGGGLSDIPERVKDITFKKVVRAVEYWKKKGLNPIICLRGIPILDLYNEIEWYAPSLLESLDQRYKNFQKYLDTIDQKKWWNAGASEKILYKYGLT